MEGKEKTGLILTSFDFKTSFTNKNPLFCSASNLQDIKEDSKNLTDMFLSTNFFKNLDAFTNSIPTKFFLESKSSIKSPI